MITDKGSNFLYSLTEFYAENLGGRVWIFELLINVNMDAVFTRV